MKSTTWTPETLQPNWQEANPARVVGAAVALEEGRAELATDAGMLRISFGLWGVRLEIGANANRDYGILATVEYCTESVAITEGESRSELRCGRHRLVLGHAPLHFELYRDDRLVLQSATDAHFTHRFRLPPLAPTAGGWFLALDLASGDRIYGLGEKWASLDHRGALLQSWNEDALGVNAEHSYKNVPFAWSPAGWGAFVHTTARVTHAVGFAPWSHRSYALLLDDAHLDLFLFSARRGSELLDDYTNLTGRAPIPPRWSLGTILSRAYYRSADEILSAAREVRARNMPCDTITFDGRAWQDTRTRFAFEFDRSRYPDPRAVIDELKRMGFRICVWEYPLVSTEGELFEHCASRGWLLKDRRSGEAYRYQWPTEAFGEVLTPLPESGLIDFTHPDAYAFWRDSHRPLFELGVDMIKPDFGEQVSEDMIAADGATGAVLHNVYALLYNRCVYEAACRYGKTGAFLFSRAGWSSSQRYPSQWGGDPQADWEGMAASLRGALSWGMSGGPYYATDVGGFYGDQRDPVLYVRWLQMAIFGAHLRLHGIGPREPWSYGVDAHRAALDCLRLRYRLLPYLQEAIAIAAACGLPVQRAMPLAFPDDPAAWAFDQQFLCGDRLLVAPCLRPDHRVRVYLPRGSWLRFPTREQLTGGRVHDIDLALDEFAAFVPEGSQIPLGPDRLYIESHEASFSIESYWPS